MMRTVCVTLEDGDMIVTRFNGTAAEIRDYYAVGTEINMGRVYDRFVRIRSVDILDEGKAGA